MADMTGTKPVSGLPNIGHEGLGSIVTMENFTPEHQKVFDAIPELIKNAIGGLYERLPFSGKWDALNSAQKLNLVCALSRTPYETVQKYVDRSGVMSIIMARGIGQSMGIVV